MNRFEIPGMIFAFLLVVGAIAVIGRMRCQRQWISAGSE